jgi:hypothetical protein
VRPHISASSATNREYGTSEHFQAKPVPHLMRDGYRFAKKMRQNKRLEPRFRFIQKQPTADVPNPKLALLAAPAFANFGFQRTLEIHDSSAVLVQTSLDELAALAKRTSEPPHSPASWNPGSANPLSALRELACGPRCQGGYSLLGFRNLSHSHPRLQLSTP